jgi:hypothetical protein
VLRFTRTFGRVTGGSGQYKLICPPGVKDHSSSTAPDHFAGHPHIEVPVPQPGVNFGDDPAERAIARGTVRYRMMFTLHGHSRAVGISDEDSGAFASHSKKSVIHSTPAAWRRRCRVLPSPVDVHSRLWRPGLRVAQYLDR